MKKIIRYYFESSFLPTMLLFVPVLLMVLGFFGGGFFVDFCFACFYFFFFAFVLYFLHLIFALFKKRWILFFFEALVFGFFGFWLFILFSFAYSVSVSGQSDTFTDDLVIPADIEVAVPLNNETAFFHSNNYAQEGSFQYELGGAIREEKVSLDSIEIGVDIDKAILLRYLASSSDWKLYYERGDLLAQRRWRFKGEPCDEQFVSLNAGLLNFSLYAKVKFDEKIEASYSKQVDRPYYFHDKQTVRFESKIDLGSAYLQLTEENKVGEPRVSHKAIELLREEFAKVAKAKDFEGVKAILPADSMKRGEPSFEIRNGMQGGIYVLSAWLNPKEAGHIYLKAFEVTKGTQLSAQRLKSRSNEVVGYSDDEEELFFSMMKFSIYEGDWGKYYAARVEIYFVPDSGAPERKLAEKVYKVEGWQR